MTPFETVLAHYKFPDRIVPHPMQVEVINDLAVLENSAEWLDMGTGKTFCSTAKALFRKTMYGQQAVVIMPPILIPQWGRWLAEITPALSVTEFRGTPAERKLKSLDADFVLVGVQIFKRHFDQFMAHFRESQVFVIVDEATICGNITSENHQKVYDFATCRPQTVLSGTPMNSVMDAYGLLKFSAPGAYYNLKAFTNLHVEEVDFYKKPIKFQNLDVLSDRMKINSKRILFEDMFPDTEEPLYVPTYYDLDPTHYKLYRKLAEEELLKLPDGGKIDGTSANKLRHALGQIVMNWGHFSGDPANIAQSVDMIDQKLSELQPGKLVVFAHYKMTVAGLAKALAKHGAVTINSEVTDKQKDDNLQRFKTDPKCRVIIIQFISGGKGLDGLQFVSNHCFFAEPCEQPRDFHQCVGRLKRLGQTKKVMVMMGIANKTTQVRGFKNLLRNDGIVNEVIRNVADLRDVIYGIN